jgi:predicted MPP superfamily phosphohydrolase
VPPRPETAFRRPIRPAPVEPYDLVHSAVPRALDGLTILHLTDTHIRRYELNHPSFRRVLHALADTPADLVVLTGDYMSHPGNEPAAIAMLRALAGAWTARLGAFGVFGNHDSPLLAAHARDIPGITWLCNRSADIPGMPLRLIGASYPEDLLAPALDRGIDLSSDEAPETPAPPRAAERRRPPLESHRAGARGHDPRFSLVLTHYPTEVFAAAELGLPIVLSGHTHGGQFRLSPRLIAHTASDMPGNLATGILRLRNTLVCVSRGLGEGFLDFRFNCPQQMPLYTLRRGETLGGAGREGFRTLKAVVRW